MTPNAAGFDFSQFVPGFDFLRQMTQPRNATPAAAQWVAPTIDPEEVDRRIQELKTVQFWLEQNTTALKATIQALEVQKMTLTTLKTMNVGLTDMAQVFQQAAAQTVSGMAAAGAVAPAEAASAPAAPATSQPAAGTNPASEEPSSTTATEADSPLNTAFAQAGQWWGSMLQTFQTIAQQAQGDVLQRQEAFFKEQQGPDKSGGSKHTSQNASAKRAPNASKTAPRKAGAAKPGARKTSASKTAATRSRKPAQE